MRDLISLKTLGFRVTVVTFIFTLVLVGLFSFVLPKDSFAGYASIVVDVDNGEVLRARNADTRNYPASLTKIMTLYMTFEALEQGRLKMTSRLKTSKRAAGQTPSKLGLKRADTISVKQAILALVTKSANDVATVLAESLGGTEWEFAQDMTRKARALGMKKTSFRNASGLPNRQQLSTARDMSILALALFKNYPQYYHYFSSRSFRFRGVRHKNHNNLLGVYKGVDGIKTGYIRSSGFNLVASAERDGRRIVAVVMGGKTAQRRDRHMKTLLDNGFIKMAALDREKALKKLASAPLPPNLPKVRNSASIELSLEQSLSKVNLTKSPGKWVIQVGAYRKQVAASRTLRKASKVAAWLLDGSTAGVTPVTSKKGMTLYRARFYGLSLLSARRACLALKTSKIPCLVMKVDNSEIYVALD